MSAVSEPGFTKRDVLLWLGNQDEEHIRAVLMVIGHDAEVEELELHGEPDQLVAQLEGPLPRLESIVVAVEDALGIDEEELGRRVRGECGDSPGVEPEDVELDVNEQFELDDDEERL
ncbi:MAG TPA: hypothetical protein ENN51_09595 [candidate division WOR-3 bacterium]|uniref:Uncharacterized protein n=1 Tax=candidate division WOR-3 bacterium TaxID=2052148 RepID=A0A7V0T7D6_UNCW3|nr:hypothetical protein [candidate division WOR-3 bacterium]